MKALKLKVMIGGDRRLVLDMPDEVEEGPAEVICFERAVGPLKRGDAALLGEHDAFFALS